SAIVSASIVMGRRGFPSGTGGPDRSSAPSSPSEGDSPDSSACEVPPPSTNIAPPATSVISSRPPITAVMMSPVRERRGGGGMNCGGGEPGGGCCVMPAYRDIGGTGDTGYRLRRESGGYAVVAYGSPALLPVSALRY